MSNPADMIQAIKDHLEAMPQTQREERLNPELARLETAFVALQSGDMLGLYYAIQVNPALVHHKDQNGMTLLHHAARDQSGLAAMILTQNPNQALWMRDQFDRVPLDVAEECGNQHAIQHLTPLTYPALFKGLEENQVEIDQLQAFADTQARSEARSTRPDWIQDQYLRKAAGIDTDRQSKSDRLDLDDDRGR